jgi:hypothetical protein
MPWVSKTLGIDFIKASARIFLGQRTAYEPRCDVVQVCARHRARCCQARPRAGRAPPTYSSGLGSPPPHLHRDGAHPSCVFPGTGLAAAHIGAGTGPHSQARQLAGTCPYVRTARYGTASHTPTLTTAAAAARADRKSVDFVQGLDDAETPVSVRSTKVRTDSGRTPATRIPSLGAGTL